jgi:ABC-type branched-subunit amino acid transport system permease subunit
LLNAAYRQSLGGAALVATDDAGVAKALRLTMLLQHEGNMQKAIALILLMAMAVQLIWPLGLPGLRHRRDFWKIAVFAIVMMMVTVLIRP